MRVPVRSFYWTGQQAPIYF